MREQSAVRHQVMSYGAQVLEIASRWVDVLQPLIPGACVVVANADCHSKPEEDQVALEELLKASFHYCAQCLDRPQDDSNFFIEGVQKLGHR